MKRVFSVLILILLSLCSAFSQAGAVQEPKQIPPRELKDGEKYKVFRLELRDAIMGEDMPFFITRSLAKAKAENVDVIILDMDTPGGRVDLAMEIRQILHDLIQIDIPTYTYVNPSAGSAGSILAISMDKIVMSPLSKIGAAQVISGGGQELSEKVERKYTSYMLADVRAAARYKGYPVRICEAFVDSEIAIDGLTSSGMVLTMDPYQATTFAGRVDPDDENSTTRTLAAFIADDIEDLLKHEGIWPAEIISYEMTWSENLAKLLMRYSGVLMLVGLIAIFIEVKSPGLGVPGAIAVIAFSLFFWDRFLADMASYMEVILFALGLILLVLEIFVIPGFGLAGVSGITLILLSLIMAMVKLPPPDIPDMEFNFLLLRKAVRNVLIVFAAMIPSIALVIKLFPSMPFYSRLALVPESAANDAIGQQVVSGIDADEKKSDAELIGKSGEAITDLRPAGTALIGGSRLDVVTEGEFIDKGQQVKLVSIHGNTRTVRKV